MDIFGNRLAGTQNLENAIDYMVAMSKNNSLNDVHTEDVEVNNYYYDVLTSSIIISK